MLLVRLSKDIRISKHCPKKTGRMGKFWKALSEQDLGLHGGPLLCETRRGRGPNYNHNILILLCIIFSVFQYTVKYTDKNLRYPPLEVSSPFQPITPHHFRPHFPGSERATPCRYVHRLHQSRTCFFSCFVPASIQSSAIFSPSFFWGRTLRLACDLPTKKPGEAFTLPGFFF